MRIWLERIHRVAFDCQNAVTAAPSNVAGLGPAQKMLLSDAAPFPVELDIWISFAGLEYQFVRDKAGSLFSET
jgi:hypothetical protein